MKSVHPYIALCGELYQVLGALGAPAHVLDKVSAASNGEEIPDTPLLPFAPQPAPSVAGMDGWRLVPLQPTEAMMIAGNNAGFWCGDAYRAMLSAAPVPPVPEPVVECTNEDSWNCKYCRKTETCAALKDERNFATPQPPAQVDEREAFEAEVKRSYPRNHELFLARACDTYANPHISIRWDGFQAGAAWQRTQSAPVPNAPLPHWEPCNPGCDPEFNGSRSRHCAKLCHNAREALAAAPSADGGKVESDEVRRLREALEYALPYLEACVPNPRNGMNADGSVDVNCVDRARAALSAQQGEGERG